jgi:hypothetical protein
MTQRPPPRFYGVRTYADPLGRFTARSPTTWHQFELEDNREGVLFSPQAENPRTWFSVWVSKLDEHVVAEDLEDLKLGVDEGLSQLADCKIELSTEEPLGNLIKFERIYTFREDDVTRKRRMWILYVDKWQMVVTYQGAPTTRKESSLEGLQPSKPPTTTPTAKVLSYGKQPIAIGDMISCWNIHWPGRDEHARATTDWPT